MTLAAGSGLTASTLTTSDGRTLRYVHGGEGGPVVVFEAGMGACASEWVTAQRLVAASTATVSYDRAGHGGSTPDTQHRSLARICEDLLTLVDHVSPDMPVVLVGHSWGGPIVRCFADLHPQRVAGAVLIDTMTTDVMPVETARKMPTYMARMVTMHRLGVGKAALRKAVFKNFGPEVTPSDRAIIDRDMTSRQSAKIAVEEAKAVEGSLLDMARWEQQGLPDVPYINLMGAGTGKGAELREPVIEGVQRETARHPQGECRVVEGTDHYVPQDKPTATAEAILDVVRNARKTARV